MTEKKKAPVKKPVKKKSQTAIAEEKKIAALEKKRKKYHGKENVRELEDKDLPGVPEGRSVLGKKAYDYVQIVKEIEKKKETLSIIGEELLIIFKDCNTNSIKVDGRVVKSEHVKSKDKINVVKDTPTI